MSRMQSQPANARLTIRLSEEKKDEFKAACDDRDETMSDVLIERVDEIVTQHQPADRPEGYYPDDPALRELYEACLDVADSGAHGPTIYQRRHASLIAQRTQQVRKSELGDALMPLRQRGFVSLGPMPPALQGESIERWRNWIIKPPEADPAQWKFREGVR